MEAFRVPLFTSKFRTQLMTADRVWTHWMKNITFHEDFQPQNCPSKSLSPQRAATLGAGVQIYEMYEQMDKYDAAVVGGANPVSLIDQVITKLILIDSL
jgi:hypothetical protein